MILLLNLFLIRFQSPRLVTETVPIVQPKLVFLVQMVRILNSQKRCCCWFAHGSSKAIEGDHIRIMLTKNACQILDKITVKVLSKYLRHTFNWRCVLDCVIQTFLALKSSMMKLSYVCKPDILTSFDTIKIIDIPHLKEGSGKKLHSLHDVAQQHLQALKAMKKYEPSGLFITSLIELKQDTNTMFEWQKFSQESDSMPHYDDLAFINLRAQASETIATESKSKFASKKPNQQTNRAVTSFAASANDSECLMMY